MTKPLASCSLLHGACAGAVYRGPYPFAEARATILKFALPVLRQGDLQLFCEHRVTSERLLVEAEGWHGLFAAFFAKSVTAGELEQEGADIRAWLGVRDEFFLSYFVFSEFLHSCTAQKLFRF